jgi:hypothetical protein
MFVFQLMGGVGNQMFQYAAARALSLKRNIPFKVEFDDPYTFVKRSYNLDFFNVSVDFASSEELNACKPKKRFEKRWWLLTGRNPDNKLVREKADYIFDTAFFDIPDGAYITGFWQAEQYLLPIRDVLLKELQPRFEPSAPNAKVLQQVADTNAVSLHIRRGDYVTVAKTSNVHGTCDMEYYKRAMAYIASKVNNPVFFIFSDDMPWVKEHLPNDYPLVFVDMNDEKNSYEDLRIMSSCNHHIIANSSFSWWGAWLNNKNDKIVICPARWTSNHLSADIDLIPKSWIKL